MRHLKVERLEDRALLATFAASGSTLNITLNSANESVGIVAGASTVVLTDTVNWSGTNSANVTGNGTTTLTITSAGRTAFTTVSIVDSAAGTAVNFNNSGSNTYVENFNVALTNASAGTIQFNGSTTFVGANSLTARTTNNLTVNTGAAVTMASGSLTLSATGINKALTLNGGITGGGGTLTLRATGDLVVGASQTINGGTGALSLGADLNSAGAGDDSFGSLVINPNSVVNGATINLRGSDYDIYTTTTIGSSSLTNSVSIQSSMISRPISIGGTNAAVNGINISDAELARIFTKSSATITIGSSSQTGNITLTTASPATTVGAGIAILQSASGAGQIILDNDAGAAAALNGNTGAITLNAGTGGIVEKSTNTSGVLDINAPSMILNSSGAIGTTTSPILVSSTNFTSDTSSTSFNQFLSSTGTISVDVSGIKTGSGSFVIVGGTLSIGPSRSVIGNVSVFPTATLTGSGNISEGLTVGTGGIVNPGTVGGVGNLTVNGLYFAGGTYSADFSGNSSDSITSTGAVILRLGASSFFAINSATGSITPGNVYTPINKTSTGGISSSPFTGLSEGTSITVNGISTTASYVGGTGNDFVLTPVFPPTTRTWDGGGADNNWSTAANWVGDVAPLPGDNLVFDSSVAGLTKYTSTNNVANFSIGTIQVNDTSASNTFQINGQSIVFGGGGTIINNISGDTVFGAPIVVTNGGLIQSQKDFLSFDGTFGISGQPLQISVPANYETYFSGSISGNQGIEKLGVGQLKLRAANTYQGTTNISAGTIVTELEGTLGNSTGATLVTEGSTLWVATSGTLNEPISLGGILRSSSFPTISGDITVTSPNSYIDTYDQLTLSGAISTNSSQFGLIFGGSSGTLIKVNGNANYVGPTQLIGQGTVQANIPLGLSSAVSIDAGARLQATFDQVFGSLAGAGELEIATTTVTVGENNSSTTFSGVISGSGFRTFSKTGSGTLTLNGANTFSGETQIQSGKLLVGNNGSLSDTTSVTVSSNATLELDTLASVEAIDTLNGAGTVILNRGVIFQVGTQFGTGTFSGSISGNGGFRKNGFGNFTLLGSSYYSGETEIYGGTLVSNGSSIPDTSTVTIGNGNFNVSSGSEVIGGLQSNGAGFITINGISLEVNSSSYQTYDSIIGGSGDFIKSGSGTLTLGASNNYSGNTRVKNGVLAMTAPGSLNGGLFVEGGTFLAANFLSFFGVQLIGGEIGGNGKLSAPSIELQSGNVSVTLDGSLFKYTNGTVTLSGIQPYILSTSIVGGTLNVLSSAGGTTMLQSSGILSGTGRADSVSGSGGTIAPGDVTSSSLGQMYIGTIDLSSTDTFLQFQLGGTSAGVNYDQLIVDGSIDSLSSGVLQVESFNGFVPASGSRYVILRNDSSTQLGTSGTTFKNLPEGSVVVVDGVTMNITYVGGDGNDIELIMPQLYSVTGTNWNDANGNGVREIGEAGLPGAPIYADLNNNGIFDFTEPLTYSRSDDALTTNDESGFYELKLSPGNYILRQDTFPRAVSFPNPTPGAFPNQLQTFYNVTVVDQNVIDRDFGSFIKTVGFNAFVQHVSESSGVVAINVELDSPLSYDFSVPFSSDALFATDLVDYRVISNEVVFPANSTHGQILVEIIDDSRVELNDNFRFRLNLSPGTKLGEISQNIFDETVIEIVSNDPSYPTIQFDKISETVNESDVTINVIAKLDRLSDFPVTLPITLSGSATFGVNSDYLINGGLTYSIPAGVQSVIIPVQIFDDVAAELGESIILTMGTPTNAVKSLSGASTRTIFIPANDAPTISLTKVAQTVSENASPLSIVNIVATLSSPAASAIDIPFSFAGSDLAPASLGSDYTTSATVFHFNGPSGSLASRTTATITMSIINDNVVEPTEQVNLKLNLSGQSLVLPGNTRSQVVTIHDDDKNYVSFSPPNGTSFWEDQGNVSVVVNMSKPSTQEVRVPIKVGNITNGAVRNSDYTLTFPSVASGVAADTLVFAPGQTSKTITLSVTNDTTRDEKDEFVKLEFGSLTNAFFDSKNTTFTQKIRDDDPTITLSKFQTVTEPSSGTTIVQVNAYLSEPTNKVVRWRLNNVNAATANSSDYSLPAKAADGFWYLTIPASTATKDITVGSFDVTVKSDSIGEDTESIALQFENNVGEATLTNATVGTRYIGGLFHSGNELASYHYIFISANDSAGISISATNTKLTEGSGTVNFTVSATNASSADIVVPITYSGSATKSSDYDKQSTSVTIKAGTTSATGSFRVIDDTNYENPETIIVKIGSPTSGTASLSSTTSVTYSIAANDAPPASPPKATNPFTLAICTVGCTGTIITPSNPGPAVIVEPVGVYPAGPLAIYFPAGYISGGTAFFDANKNSVLDFLDLNLNGMQDSNEPSEDSITTTLNGFAGFEVNSAFDQNNDGFLDSSEGQIVVVGGIDTSIDLPLVGAMIGPAGVYVPTPLTTLMATLVNQYDFTVVDASDQVQASLDLPIRDLRAFDHLAATLAGDPAGPQVFSAEVKVQDTIASSATFLAAFPNAPTSFALANLVASEIAYKMLEPDSSVELSNSAVIESILNAIVQQTGLTVDESVVTGAAQIIAASNQAIDNVTVTVDEAYLTEVARVQKVSQLNTLNQLIQVAQGTADINTVVTANTGTSLANQVSQTTVGDIVPPVAGVTDARIVEGTNGQRELVFTVALSKTSTEPVSINYYTQDGTATEGDDYVAKSGTLSWLPGDMSNQTIRVLVNSDLLSEPDEYVDLVLTSPQNVALVRDLGTGVIVNDDLVSFNTGNSASSNTIQLNLDGDQVSITNNGQYVTDGSYSGPALTEIAGANDVSDSLTLDFLTNSSLLAGGIQFHGGSGAGTDSAVIKGGLFEIITQRLFNANDGQTILDPFGTNDNIVFDWDGLEPFTIANSSDQIIFELPAGVTTAILEDADPTDLVNPGMLRLRSPDGHFETTTFANPTSSIIIRGGNGADAITIGDLDSAFVGTVRIDTTALGTNGVSVTYDGWSAASNEEISGLNYQVFTKGDSPNQVNLKIQLQNVTPTLSITSGDIVYNNSAYVPTHSIADYNAPAPNVSFVFYRDAGGTDIILAPENVGTYFVRVFSAPNSVNNEAQSAITSFQITPRTITGNITASNKVFDSTTTATILTRTLTDVLVGDAVSYIGGTATFDTSAVGNGKTVTATGLSLSGADAANYTVNSTVITTANITQPAATVAKGYIFYNDSGFESSGGVAAAIDDPAINFSNSKVLVQSNSSTQTSTFANVSNYTRGINGLVFDVKFLVASSLTESDFIFRRPSGLLPSGLANPSSWNGVVPSPTAIGVTAGSTFSDPSRIRIEWEDNKIQNTWLQVIIKANANTGLLTPAVFYLGHALGEVNGTSPYRVTTADVSQIAPFVSTDFVSIANPRDVNKDRRITTADLSAVNPRVSNTIILNNITFPAAGSFSEGSGSGFGSLFLAFEGNGSSSIVATPPVATGSTDKKVPTVSVPLKPVIGTAFQTVLPSLNSSPARTVDAKPNVSIETMTESTDVPTKSIDDFFASLGKVGVA